MGTYNIRLGCQLAFDEQQEADIIKAIEALNSSHKTGQFVSNVLRLAFDCPEIMDKSSGQYEKGAVLKAMENSGLSYNRLTFMNQITKEVNTMKQKVDDMYNMVLKTYILAQMGKHLGLEEKADNQLMAQFICEKQLKELQDILGTSLNSSTLASNKKADIEKIANEALEYIIESYSGIVNEIKAITSSVVVQTSNQAISDNTHISSIAETTENVSKDTEKVAENKEIIEESTKDNNDDEYIDFGNADIGALANFFAE